MLTDKNIIVIGDVHGRTSWRKIVDRHTGCRFVFLGDYCDPYEEIPGEAVLDNLREIIQFKQAHADDVVLLLGNHDVHYLENRAPIGSRFDLELAWQIEEILTTNKDLFQCAYSQWGILFTHAGVSDAWFRQSFVGDADGDIASQLNARAADAALCHCGASRRGPHLHGGIYWAGKSEMQCPLRGTTQVVGHTRTDGVERIESGEGVVYFCDCLEKGKYLMIVGTSAMVQTELDSIVNQYTDKFNNPMVMWGKYRKGWFKTTLPISFQFHHSQMDGGHGAMFLELLQREIKGL